MSSLRGFLETPDIKRDISHVKDEISPRFEASYLMRRLEDTGRVLLFERLTGSDGRLVANVCGTRHRVCQALGVRQDHLFEERSR